MFDEQSNPLIRMANNEPTDTFLLFLFNQRSVSLYCFMKNNIWVVIFYEVVKGVWLTKKAD